MGISNYAFHIPYVLRSSELPVFLGDAFYQSMEKFTSIIWPIVRSFSTEENIEPVFFTAHILSRAAAFSALFWFLKVNGTSRPSAITISLAAAAVTPWLISSSVVGGHGLFIGYFTHSEATWGPLVAAMVAAQLGRFTLSAFLTGIVFLINAFVGIWLAAILAMGVVMDPEKRPDWRLLAKSSLVFLFTCSPVVVWITFALSNKKPVPDFSYIDYIRQYYPAHFLIEAASFRDLVSLSILTYCGFAAAFLHTNRKFWMSTLSACIILLLVGSVAPYVFNTRNVFNLHLLRSDGVLQFLAIILTISATTLALTEIKSKIDVRVVAVLAISSLMSMRTDIIYLIFVAMCLSYLAAAQLCNSGTRFTWLNSISLGVRNCIASLLVFSAIFLDLLLVGYSYSSIARWFLVLGIIYLLIKYPTKPTVENAVIPILCILLSIQVAHTANTWRSFDLSKKSQIDKSTYEMMRWIRQSKLTGPFLFPVDGIHGLAFNEFQFRTQRPVWIDLKQGAAVMWDPSFYWQWMPRFTEVNSLVTPNDYLNYAAKNRIPQVVLPRTKGFCPAGSVTAFENASFSVCSIALPAGLP
ncbi:hypothetical protein [Rhodoferax sp. WC2427]|uniref:hypothetical protein n=1 Tax=Rhodoferax sp. WC2427 TaxID=3234144 RepID=UPI0034652FB2